MEKYNRFVIELLKIPSDIDKRVKKTIPVAYYDTKGMTHLPSSNVLNTVLKEIETNYNKFLKLYKEDGSNIRESLDWFFQEVWKRSIVKGDGLIEILSRDLRVKKSDIEKELIGTQWYRNLLSCIQENSRKQKNKRPVKYAECIRQLVELAGKDNALKILSKNEVSLGKTAIDNLSRFGGELPEIKQLVRDGKLKLTIAWELPRVGEEERLKIAEELASLGTYREQKERLKEIRRNLRS